MQIKKSISLITILCYLCVSIPTIAYAQEVDEEPKITTLRKGQPAPYSGTLFNTSAAAKLQVDLAFTKETCQIEINRELSLLKSRLELDINLLTARLDSQKKLHLDIVTAKNDQIKFLEEQTLQPKWYESNELWLSVGLLSGIALTAIAGWALGQAGGIN